ncbi:ribosomal protein S12 methylthiotransferase RimO [Muribaculaceae bacterium]|jgi:ribosomal protein S12 methylthiotransferase|nr:30S ribosomal protein S12 methylthiotransferase RimO [Muribaculaceae bacterium]GFI06498.1 ribosomal protein S12 methylthiotransferase RimO [Muribaculaceae bacterium]
MKRRQVNIVSLGCSKNLVDTERLLSMMAANGIRAEVTERPDLPADILVVNTCGFIGDAKEESIDTILQGAEAKANGRINRIFVMGCLSERYAKELPAELPEVDGWYGKFDWPAIVSDITGTQTSAKSHDRIITTPGHHAYLKVSEGCNRFCAFCAIPLITGRMHSRPIEELEAEVRALTSRGVKEFNIIAQDLSSYGTDLGVGHRQLLPQMVERLADIPGVEWLRLHYAYPTDFPRDLLRVMAERENVCSYLDIALQHISDPVLSNMRRHITGAQTRDLIAEMRATVPDLHLRTTLMVGFPGEGDKEFDELMEFVAQTRFERMGAFAYCEEDDTYAAKHLPDNIPGDVKAQRLDRLMALQESISLDIQENKIGQTFKVIIDREEADYYVGRTQWDSPEVDPEVLVEKDRRLNSGDFVNVTITSAMPFELIGKANG